MTRAVLISLPPSFDDKVSWKTNWDGDEARRAWHEHKMKTKVTRPAAQIKKLFGVNQPRSRLRMPLLSQKGGEEPELHYGVVYHFSESIPPPIEVEVLCMVCTAMFQATVSS